MENPNEGQAPGGDAPQEAAPTEQSAPAGEKKSPLKIIIPIVLVVIVIAVIVWFVMQQVVFTDKNTGYAFA